MLKLDTQISRNELGSPPLLTLLEKLRPRQWFSAHLHVYFKAKWLSVTESSSNKRISSSHINQPIKRLKVVDDSTDTHNNLDEIAIEDEDDDRPAEGQVIENDHKPNSNPEEIAIEDEEEDGGEDGLKKAGVADDASIPHTSDDDATHFTALDKSLPNRKFLEVGVIHCIINCFTNT